MLADSSSLVSETKLEFSPIPWLPGRTVCGPGLVETSPANISRNRVDNPTSKTKREALAFKHGGSTAPFAFRGPLLRLGKTLLSNFSDRKRDSPLGI